MPDAYLAGGRGGGGGRGSTQGFGPVPFTRTFLCQDCSNQFRDLRVQSVLDYPPPATGTTSTSWAVHGRLAGGVEKHRWARGVVGAHYNTGGGGGGGDGARGHCAHCCRRVARGAREAALTTACR